MLPEQNTSRVVQDATSHIGSATIKPVTSPVKERLLLAGCRQLLHDPINFKGALANVALQTEHLICLADSLHATIAYILEVQKRDSGIEAT